MPLTRRLRGLFTLLLLASSFALAADATFSVVDQQGQPLNQAVITITSASIAAEAPAPAVHLMDQNGKRFQPDVIAINKGDSIRFPNSDDIRHHVYSFSVPLTFELPLYSGEPKNPVLFQEAGTVIVGCNIHDRMQGYIYVIDDARYTKSVNGKANFSGLPAEALTVTIYHPEAATDPALRFQLQPGEAASAQPYRIEMKAVPEPDTSTMTELEKKFLQLRHGAHQSQQTR
jgi:plastocyanin